MRFEMDKFFNIASIFCIFSFSFLMIILSYSKKPIAGGGERDDYALETIAIQTTGNIEITEAVVERGKQDFPDLANSFDLSWAGVNAGSADLYRAYNGKIYPWYGAAYSGVCIPIKLLLHMLHLNQTYTFALTNICLYLTALLYVFFRLKSSRKNVFLMILLLACSPVSVYCSWASAEVFIFSFLVLSLTNFVNKNYRRAALYVAIAGSMNTTAMVLGIIIIINYFVELLQGTHGIKEAGTKIIQNFKNILLFGMCFLPGISTYIYNLINMHQLELQTTLGLARTDFLIGRFWAYLFDFNFGYIVYYFFCFVVWLILVVLGVIKRQRSFLMLSTAFLGVVLAYSFTWHINCGMEGISRYSAWAAPIFLFAVVTQYESILDGRIIRQICSATIIISAISTVIVLNWFYNYNRLSYTQYTPLAEIALNTCPWLYNPYPYTFVSRTQHIDGGYWGNEDKTAFYYEDEDGYVRKILVVDETKNFILEHLLGTPEDVAIVQESLSTAKHFEYINLNKGIEVFIDRDYPEAFYPAKDDTLSQKSRGIYEREGDKHWFSNNATIILDGKEMREKGIEIQYYVIQEMIDKYHDKTLIGQIYCNGKLIGTIDLNQAGFHIETISPDALPECETGYYSIKIKSVYYLQPSIDMSGETDERKLCIYVPYIGAPTEH